MLGDIVCNHVLVSHLVATFSFGDHRDGHGRYTVPASWSFFSILCLFWLSVVSNRVRKHTHFVAWAHMPSIFQECRDNRRQKCRNHVSDQELGANQNVTKHVISPPTVWVSPLIISVVYVIWFGLRFSHEFWWLKQWHLAALLTARKKQDYACAGISQY